MDAVIAENKQRIRTLTATGRRVRRKTAELVRLRQTIESVTDALLLARSRCAVLNRQLDHAERRADAATIAELAPEIMKAVVERNLLQKNFVKLTARLLKRFGIQTPTPDQNKSASA